MNRKSIVTALFTAATLAVGSAIAANPEQAGAAKPEMNMNRPGMSMQHGMMGGEAGKGGGSRIEARRGGSCARARRPPCLVACRGGRNVTQSPPTHGIRRSDLEHGPPDLRRCST